METNNAELAADLDTVDEIRDTASVRIAAYQQTIARSFNKNVRIRTFAVGDLVLRQVVQHTKDRAAGKLSKTWEGPYLVDSISG